MSKVKLMFGDCLERMAEIPDASVDLILADPPYGSIKCSWDVVIPLKPMWKGIYQSRKGNIPIVLMAQQPFTTILIASNITNYKYNWVWDKVIGYGHLDCSYRPLRQIEDILIFGGKDKVFYKPLTLKRGKIAKWGWDRGSELTAKVKEGRTNTNIRYPTNILRFQKDSRKYRKHPTQKPVALMEYLIKTYSQRGDTVLDFCMGSGTTGVACKHLGRNFIGIEKDPKYFQVAKRRIQHAKFREDLGFI